MADRRMAERLRLARETDGRFGDASEAARRLGVRPSTYLGHENGSRGFMRSAGIYAAFYRVDFKWLLTGAGVARPKAADARFLDLTPEEQAQLDNFAAFLRQQRKQP